MGSCPSLTSRRSTPVVNGTGPGPVKDSENSRKIKDISSLRNRDPTWTRVEKMEQNVLEQHEQLSSNDRMYVE